MNYLPSFHNYNNYSIKMLLSMLVALMFAFSLPSMICSFTHHHSLTIRPLHNQVKSYNSRIHVKHSFIEHKSIKSLRRYCKSNEKDYLNIDRSQSRINFMLTKALQMISGMTSRSTKKNDFMNEGIKSLNSSVSNTL